MTARRARYLTGQAGQVAYAAQAARNTTPRGDPQRTATWRDPRLVVAELMVPCANADEPCGHPLLEHHLTEPSDEWPAGHRTRCTRGTAAGWCPCRAYTSPQTEGDPP